MRIFVIIALIALLGAAPFLFTKNKPILETKKMSTRQMMYIVTFSALAIVIGFFEIPIGFIGVKLDLSEVIILMAFLVLGFKNASYVIVLRSLVRMILPSKTAMETDMLWKALGEVIAILASYLIIFSYFLTKKVLKIKEKPLMIAVPTEKGNIDLKVFVVASIITPILLTLGMTVFHTLITMPMYLSGNEHFFITSLLNDSKYVDNNILSIIKTIIVMFGLVNVIKGIISPIVFLMIKPQIEKIIT
ncbi:MAG: hypothetical protein RBQ97_02300 [Acholeplasma sp.]|nr:hypothetical protein [Acholeplasma sp.]